MVLASRYARRLPGSEDAFAFVSSDGGRENGRDRRREDVLTVDAVDGMMEDARKCERCIALVEELRGGVAEAEPPAADDNGDLDDGIEWEDDSIIGGRGTHDGGESMKTLRKELSELRRLIVVRHLPKLRKCIDALTLPPAVGGAAVPQSANTAGADAVILERATAARDYLSIVDTQCETLKVQYFSAGLVTSGFDVDIDAEAF